MSQMMQTLHPRSGTMYTDRVAMEDLVAAEVVYNKALGEGVAAGVVL